MTESLPAALDVFTDNHRWGDLDEWNRTALALHDRGGIHRVEADGFTPFWAVINHQGVLDVDMHVVERPDGRVSGFFAQPLVPRELLAEVILATEDPRPDHPIVLAHREVAMRDCTPEYAVDLTISNFAFDGDRYALLDITSPVTWAADGTFTGLIPKELLSMAPAPIRPIFRKEYAKAANGMRDPRGALNASLVFLHRVGQGRWAPAFAEVFNEVLDEPLDVDAARAEFERFKKVIPMVKRTSRLQRWWQTKFAEAPTTRLLPTASAANCSSGHARQIIVPSSR